MGNLQSRDHKGEEGLGPVVLWADTLCPEMLLL